MFGYHFIRHMVFYFDICFFLMRHNFTGMESLLSIRVSLIAGDIQLKSEVDMEGELHL